MSRATVVTLPERVFSDDPRYTWDQYNPSQAAAYLQISRNQMYELFAAKRVAHAKASPFRIICSQRDLDDYNATRRQRVIVPTGELQLVRSDRAEKSERSRRFS